MGVFNWQTVDWIIHSYTIPVLCTWLGQWMLALSFSRFARWRARSDGGEAWARWALLPAYEAAIVFKKVGLVVLIVVTGFVSTDITSESASIRTAVSWAIFFFSARMYKFTYVIVIFVLCARSAGTTNMYRSVLLMLALSCVVSAVTFFEFSGVVNEEIAATNTALNGTVPLLPSFGGMGFSRFMTIVPGRTEYAYPSNVFPPTFCWLALVLIATAIIGTILVWAKCWCPRQPRLATALYVLFFVVIVLEYFTQWNVISTFFGFDALVLVGVIEVPLKYWLMLCDSNVRWTLHSAPRAHTFHVLLSVFIALAHFAISVLTSLLLLSPVLELPKHHRRQLLKLCRCAGRCHGGQSCHRNERASCCPIAAN